MASRIFLVLLLWLPSSLWAALPVAYKDLGLKSTDIGVYIQAVDSKQPLVSHHSKRLFNPASVIKLVTTLVGLEILGPSYQWYTDVYAQGPVRQGVLQGDLWLKGTGDPFLVVERVAELVKAIQARGVNQIQGQLRLDSSYLQTPPAKDSFDKNTFSAYNVQPNALLMNFQSGKFTLQPLGKRVKISLYPKPAHVQLVNQLKLTQGRCGSWRNGFRIMRNQQQGNYRITFSGKYPKACGERSLYQVVEKDLAYSAGLFQALWRDQGGQISERWQPGRWQGQQQPLVTFLSVPLFEVVRAINKRSNNVMAKQLFLTLGAYQYGSPGTLAKSRQVIRQWLQHYGLRFDNLFIDNGSGLSRISRITPQQLTQILQRGYQSPYMAEFVDSLPLSGVDGTLRRNPLGPAVKNKAQLKTGTLRQVKSLAGYVTSNSGRLYAVSILMNGKKVNRRTGFALQKRFVNWLVKQG